MLLFFIFCTFVLGVISKVTTYDYHDSKGGTDEYPGWSQRGSRGIVSSNMADAGQQAGWVLINWLYPFAIVIVMIIVLQRVFRGDGGGVLLQQFQQIPQPQQYYVY